MHTSEIRLHLLIEEAGEGSPPDTILLTWPCTHARTAMSLPGTRDGQGQLYCTLHDADLTRLAQIHYDQCYHCGQGGVITVDAVRGE